MEQTNWTDTQWATVDTLDRMLQRGPYYKRPWERQTFAELMEQVDSLRGEFS